MTDQIRVRLPWVTLTGTPDGPGRLARFRCLAAMAVHEVVELVAGSTVAHSMRAADRYAIGAPTITVPASKRNSLYLAVEGQPFPDLNGPLVGGRVVELRVYTSGTVDSSYESIFNPGQLKEKRLSNPSTGQWELQADVLADIEAAVNDWLTANNGGEFDINVAFAIMSPSELIPGFFGFDLATDPFPLPSLPPGTPLLLWNQTDPADNGVWHTQESPTDPLVYADPQPLSLTNIGKRVVALGAIGAGESYPRLGLWEWGIGSPDGVSVMLVGSADRSSVICDVALHNNQALSGMDTNGSGVPGMLVALTAQDEASENGLYVFPGDNLPFVPVQGLSGAVGYQGGTRLIARNGSYGGSLNNAGFTVLLLTDSGWSVEYPVGGGGGIDGSYSPGDQGDWYRLGLNPPSTLNDGIDKLADTLDQHGRIHRVDWVVTSEIVVADGADAIDATLREPSTTPAPENVPSTGQTICLVAQSDATQNGLYVVQEDRSLVRAEDRSDNSGVQLQPNHSDMVIASGWGQASVWTLEGYDGQGGYVRPGVSYPYVDNLILQVRCILPNNTPPEAATVGQAIVVDKDTLTTHTVVADRYYLIPDSDDGQHGLYLSNDTGEWTRPNLGRFWPLYITDAEINSENYGTFWQLYEGINGLGSRAHRVTPGAGREWGYDQRMSVPTTGLIGYGTTTGLLAPVNTAVPASTVTLAPGEMIMWPYFDLARTTVANVALKATSSSLEVGESLHLGVFKDGLVGPQTLLDSCEIPAANLSTPTSTATGGLFRPSSGWIGVLNPSGNSGSVTLKALPPVQPALVNFDDIENSAALVYGAQNPLAALPTLPWNYPLYDTGADVRMVGVVPIVGASR